MVLPSLFVATIIGLSYHHTGVTEDDDPTFNTANRLYRALTNGSPLLPENPLYSPVLGAVSSNDLAGAARLITDPRTGAREFYDVLVAGIPQHWGRDNSLVGDRHEINGMFVGYARDNIAFKDILTRDLVYYDRTLTGADAYIALPQVHFREVFKRKSARDALTADVRPGFGGVGIFTSYPWFKDYIDMGTNRRSVYGMLNHLYCTDIKHVQSFVIPDKFVKRDVPRTPAGNVNDYLTNCVGCHAWMDAFIPRAFARYDTNNNNNNPIPLYGVPADQINETNFDKEPITTDDWHLFLTAEQNRIFRFNGLPGKPLQDYGSTELKYLKGQGLQMYGELIGNSDGFYNCIAKQLVTRVYLKKQFSLDSLSEEDKLELATQEPIIESFGQMLKANQNLRSVIEAIAVYFVGGGA